MLGCFVAFRVLQCAGVQTRLGCTKNTAPVSQNHAHMGVYRAHSPHLSTWGLKFKFTARIDCQKLSLGSYHRNYYWIELVLNFFISICCRGTVGIFTVHTHVLFARCSASTVDELLITCQPVNSRCTFGAETCTLEHSTVHSPHLSSSYSPSTP
jgi:hypothetical protein